MFSIPASSIQTTGHERDTSLCPHIERPISDVAEGVNQLRTQVNLLDDRQRQASVFSADQVKQLEDALEQRFITQQSLGEVAQEVDQVRGRVESLEKV